MTRRAWILTDGKAGDELPLIAVAEALGMDVERRQVRPPAPHVWLMPHGPIPVHDRPDQPASPIAPPFPDLCLAAGRRTVAYLRALKAVAPDVVTVFLRNPQTRRHGADLVIGLAHDQMAGEGVFEIIAAPHRFSADRLAALRAAPPEAIARLPQPRIAVLVGGDSRHFRFTGADIARFAAGLEALAAEGAGLMVTLSRRTPPALGKAIKALAADGRVIVYDGDGPNPLPDFLSHADRLIVTADSTNMLGEAAATGRPIQIFRPSGGHRRIDRFIGNLARIAITAPFPGAAPAGSYPPYDSTPAVAAAISALMDRRKA